MRIPHSPRLELPGHSSVQEVAHVRVSELVPVRIGHWRLLTIWDEWNIFDNAVGFDGSDEIPTIRLFNVTVIVKELLQARCQRWSKFSKI